jgi:hypothetical protein
MKRVSIFPFLMEQSNNLLEAFLVLEKGFSEFCNCLQRLYLRISYMMKCDRKRKACWIGLAAIRSLAKIYGTAPKRFSSLTD